MVVPLSQFPDGNYLFCSFQRPLAASFLPRRQAPFLVRDSALTVTADDRGHCHLVIHGLTSFLARQFRPRPMPEREA
jgi:hypothetical protein